MSIHIKDPEQKAHGCIIWMHGLGADASDMMGLANELPLAVPMRHVFIDAPVRPVTLNNHMRMRAWYDIVGITLNDREDKTGILASESLIRGVIEQQLLEGFSADTIFLAGFSQGGAMALYTGLRTTIGLGGVISLSGYIPLLSETRPTLPSSTPFFIAAGDYDPIVLPVWTAMSTEFLRQQGYQNLAWHRYPMDHSICGDEIRDLSQWLTKVVEELK